MRIKINPELQRNIWLEISTHRLIGMPLGLAALFLLVFFLNQLKVDNSLAGFGLGFFWAISILWGSRLASESVLSEIKDRTWDSQRMSTLGPWSMTWGKLLGSTIFTWYGGIFCLLIYGFSAENNPAYRTILVIIIYILGGLLSHSIGLLASLTGLLKKRIYDRSLTASYLVLAIIVVSPVLAISVQDEIKPYWYGTNFDNLVFTLGSLLIFTTWAVIGIYRLMRSELQLKCSPWVWVSFQIFLLFYCAGFINSPMFKSTEILPARVVFSFALSVALSYLTIFSDKKDAVQIRRVMQYMKNRLWRMALNHLPYWVFSLSIVFILSLVAIYVINEGYDIKDGVSNFQLFILSVLFFLIRDIGIILFFNFAKNHKRADMACIFYFVVLYGILPGILATLDIHSITVLFWPRFDDLAGFSLLAGIIEVFIFSIFVLKRWRVNFAGEDILMPIADEI